jgi:hypothetical protein
MQPKGRSTASPHPATQDLNLVTGDYPTTNILNLSFLINSQHFQHEKMLSKSENSQISGFTACTHHGPAAEKRLGLRRSGAVSAG